MNILLTILGIALLVAIGIPALFIVSVLTFIVGAFVVAVLLGMVIELAELFAKWRIKCLK